MQKNFYFLAFLFITLYLPARENKPNIIFILADDMGYGDIAHNGGLAATPHCDRLAQEGVRFTDAHSASSVCTPTRYSILTGRYNWRSRLKKGVLKGFDAPLIAKDRLTIAGFLQKQGYKTAAIGKWHLGLGWQKMPRGKSWPKGKDFAPGLKGSNWHPEGWYIDYSKEFSGPLNNGFDYFYGISASLDMPPYVFLENNKVSRLPDARKTFSKPIRPGAAAADFEANQCLISFAAKSRAYIKEQSQNKENPFFLYLALSSPHTPILPSKKWQGKSALGAYGDFIMETDWVVGQVLAELKEQGLDKNTLLIFTTDNGCAPKADIAALAAKGHKANGDFRGAKFDIYEGGHRVPFIARWPEKIPANKVIDKTICSVDFFRTAAEVADAEDNIPDSAAEDSFSLLPLLTGKGHYQRKTTIHHSTNGKFSIRHGRYKLSLTAGSGSSNFPKDSQALKKGLPNIQLYDMKSDPSETKNLQDQMPEVIESLVNRLAAEIKNGRTTPGKYQNNDGKKITFTKDILKRFPQLK